MAAVTVVVPCYRCAHTVERAVRSAAMQSEPASEIILVDDASGDATPDALRALQREFGEDRVRLIELPRNAGPAGARNAGWEAASGEFVAFLDADDAWRPRKIELQHRFMQEHPEYAFSGHANLWLRAGASAPEVEPAPGFAEVTRAQLLVSNRFTTSSIMLRRSIAQRFRDGQRHMEDHLLWMTLACAGLRAARLNAALSLRFAAPFGEAGLSGNLLAMERAELTNYLCLYRTGALGTAWLATLVPWSLAKFGRRLALTAWRRALTAGAR
jgi:glycosyltransferase involved in cell wall biosynthesis